MSPLWRRAGVASSLISSAERLARAWGYRAVYLHVDGINEGAKRLYEARGFAYCGEDPAWLGPFGGRVLLNKQL